MFDYPAPPTDATAEDLHGIRVPDPFRPLEDPDSPATAAWTEAQNAFAEPRLAALPARAWFAGRLDALHGAPRAGTPWWRGGRHLRFVQPGGREQALLLVADDLGELAAGGRVLVDPEEFGDPGTVALSSASVSPDGRYVAYALSFSGSDWLSLRIREIDGGRDLPDRVNRAKFTTASWFPDSSGFVYWGYPAEGRGTGDGRDSAALGAGSLLHHRLGTGQASDAVVRHAPDAPRELVGARFSHDGRWLLLSVAEGAGSENRLYAHRVAGGRRLGPRLTVRDAATDRFEPVEADGDTLFVLTDADAPAGRLVSVDLAEVERGGEARLRTVVPEREHALEQVAAAGEGFLLVHLVDAAHRVTGVDADGGRPRELPLGDRVSVPELHAVRGRDEAFLATSGFLAPRRSVRLTPSTGALAPVPAPVGAAPPTPARTARASAVSADGTSVRYTLLRPEGSGEGPLPTLLWGYGGFDLSVTPAHRPLFAAWVQAGGQVAVANLRGGGETGRAWHEGGARHAKQRVFDDFAAVAEHLAETGAARPDQLALHGRSNGGLLVGAVLTQRPGLAACALPAVGVLDMLRFHRFTIGHAWVNEYGDPDDPEDFRVLLAYSPLHNVRPGTAYPAVLVQTADHDDRVVPAHSYKFAAALQAAQSGPEPVLLRVYGGGGHGAGTRRSTTVAQEADALAFAADRTGLAVAEEPPRAVSARG